MTLPPSSLVGMANRHFAKLADVWKHLPLCEVLSLEHPGLYWESHAGSAAYEMVDDVERRFGVLGFCQAAEGSEKLAASSYLRHLHHVHREGQLPIYPGSPLLAMAELGAEATYTFCDLDPESQIDLRAWADRLGLIDSVKVVPEDGVTTLHEALSGVDPGELLVHVDPFDPWELSPQGTNSVDLAAEIAHSGGRLLYWYGYDRPEQRAWALEAIAAKTTTPLWCGDIMVTANAGLLTRDDGNLGQATTPGTGCGIVCANLTSATLLGCREMGEALADAYGDGRLPNDTPGRLEFLSR